MPPDKNSKENILFNRLFAAMGLLLLGIAGWIGASVAHIPSIEQKIDDFIVATEKNFVNEENRLSDHENRIRFLESSKKNE